jgi:hypothetical protein
MALGDAPGQLKGAGVPVLLAPTPLPPGGLARQLPMPGSPSQAPGTSVDLDVPDHSHMSLRPGQLVLNLSQRQEGSPGRRAAAAAGMDCPEQGGLPLAKRLKGPAGIPVGQLPSNFMPICGWLHAWQPPARLCWPACTCSPGCAWHTQAHPGACTPGTNCTCPATHRPAGNPAGSPGRGPLAGRRELAPGGEGGLVQDVDVLNIMRLRNEIGGLHRDNSVLEGQLEAVMEQVGGLGVGLGRVERWAGAPGAPRLQLLAGLAAC